MNDVEALAAIIEMFALPNRYGDAMNIAAKIEALITLRINQAFDVRSKSEIDSGIEAKQP